MSNTTEDTNCVGENAIQVTQAVYGMDFYSDVELEVMLNHAAYGGSTPHTLAQIAAELGNRRVRDLVMATSKHVDTLITAVNRNFVVLSKKIEKDVATINVDDVVYAHRLLTAHARNLRRSVEQLKRHTRYF